MNVEIKTFKIFIAIENILGFGRSFVTFRKPVKVLVIVRILTEIVLALYSVYASLDRNIPEKSTEYFTSLYSYGSILLSYYYSKSYMKLISYFNSGHVHFKGDNVYKSRLTKFLKLAIYLWYVYFVSVCILDITFFYDNLVKQLGFLETLNKLLISLRFYYEYAFLYCILCMISEQLKSILRSIRNRRSDGSSTEIETSMSKLSYEFEEWLLNCSNIKNISNLFNKVFGIQLGLSLAIIVIRNVAMFYRIISSEIRGTLKGLNVVGSISFHIATLVSFMLTAMVARAAQRVQNSARDLTCGLQQLEVELLASLDNTQQKEINRLLREVLTRPIYIKTFGGLNVNMTIIPSCVGLITSYTVVALQFNNVV